MSATNGSSAKIRAVVIGASGYSGAEAIDLLLGHPDAELVGVFGSASRQGEPIAEIFPRFRERTDLAIQPTSIDAVHALDVDAVFLATPHEASASLAPELLGLGVTVLDISGAFRITNPQSHKAAYSFDRDEEITRTAAYGLPEHHRDEISEAQLVACPGCYPTSVILPVKPLVEAGLLDVGQPVIADCISGTSGAGRSANVATLLSEVSVHAYKVGAHRHEPEMIEHVGVDVMFTPHLGCYDRGISSTMHAKLCDGVDEAQIRAVLEEVYEQSPFVRVLPAGVTPTIRDVVRTNLCDIAVFADASRGRVILLSALDNLVKGAAGQAVQCFNLCFGLPETAGLVPSVARGSAVPA
ncbi:MAG: N-acetyl-gamma-glutamyl-phosphate reductase [Planctomycetota bacterium]